MPGKRILFFCFFACLLAGCARGAGKASPPPAEIASEDMTRAQEALEGGTEAGQEEAPEQRLSAGTAIVGICLSKSQDGDNERLVPELVQALADRGFVRENLLVQDFTGSRSRQEAEVEDCLERGASVVIVSAVQDARIPGLADKIVAAGGRALFVNCNPGEEELARWEEADMPCAWLGATYDSQLACQMSILYDSSGTDRGVDFNGDGHIGAILVGGGEQAREALEVAAGDMGTQLQILGETDGSFEKVSEYVQGILNERKKEVDLVLCSTDALAQAAADGVQLRHRLVGRDILVIGTDAHEEACTAIINKLMSGSTFTDFYEQADLAAVAARDLVDGNLAGHRIEDVIFKVTEENAQEVLDLLWRTREKE